MKKFNTQIISLIAVAAMFAFSACSGKKSAEGDIPPEDLPAADAATDAVPSDLPDPAAGDPTALPAPTEDAAAQVADAPMVAPPMDPVPVPPMDAVPAPAPMAPPVQAAAETFDSAPSSGVTSDYRIQAGDTLMKIAFETYGDLYRWKDIYEMNKAAISDPNSLSAGVVLKLDKPATPVVIERNGDQYLIKKGDTLGTISDDVYGTRTKWKKLWENNRQMIKDPNKIFAGFYLYYVPEAGVKPRVKEVPVADAAPAMGADPTLPAAGAPQGDAFAAPPAPGTDPAAPLAPPPADGRLPAGQ